MVIENLFDYSCPYMVGIKLVIRQIGLFNRIQHSGRELANFGQTLSSSFSCDEAAGVLKVVYQRFHHRVPPTLIAS